jgi:DinB superfamily/Pentapeptide repeats (8 copies)
VADPGILAIVPEEFEGDLAGAVFWGADLSGAVFRDVNLTDAKISHASLVNVDIDAFVDNIVINGVDVTAYVNERDPWFPLRTMLRPSTPDGMRLAWHALEQSWSATIARASALREAALHEKVNDEFSFVQTIRHLVFAIDKWFTVPILGVGFDPIGLPNSGSVGFPWPGLNYDLAPSVAEALSVRADRSARLSDYLASLSATNFDRPVDVLENGPHPTQECLYTVFEEEFWHNRYALRDLALLEAAGGTTAG